MSARVLPAPTSIRWTSVRAAPHAAPRRVPFGVAGWSADEDADAVAITLDVPESWPASGAGELASIAAQLPDAASLADGTLLVVLPEAAHETGILGKLLMRRPPSIARAVRGSALLARGYTRLGGAIDPASGLDLAWGWA